MANATGNQISYNTINDSRTGVYIGEECFGNLIYNNTFISNKNEGIDMDGGASSRASYNRIIDNDISQSGTGIEISAAPGNNLSGNALHNNSIGLKVEVSDNTFVFNDHLYNNLNEDIQLVSTIGSNFDYIFQNVIIDNPAGDYANYSNLSITDNLAGVVEIGRANV